MLVDDNGITLFVDDNGVTSFIDDNGLYLGVRTFTVHFV
jgi:hypothetical protein